MENKAVYVGIENSVMIRRDVLTSSINFIRLLERYEHLKEIRANKENEILYLKTLLKEIRNYLNQYHDSLPWVQEKEEKPVKVAHKEKGGEERREERREERKEFRLKLKKVVEKKRPVTEIDKLKNELSEIEGKLAGISGY